MLTNIKRKNEVININKIKAIVESSILVAISILLSVIFAWTVGLTIKFIFPDGWIPIFAIPIFILIVRRNGIIIGILASISHQIILFIMTSGAIVTAINLYSFILDYVVGGPTGLLIAWMCISLLKNSNIKWIIFSVTLSIFWFIPMFMSGILFYSSFVPTNMGVFIYSFIYNLSAILVGWILFIIIYIPTRQSLFKVDVKVVHNGFSK